jgi:hypothetical protein
VTTVAPEESRSIGIVDAASYRFFPALLRLCAKPFFKKNIYPAEALHRNESEARRNCETVKPFLFFSRIIPGEDD